MRLMLTNMKNSLVFLALLCINSAFGQVNEQFNDGDFTIVVNFSCPKRF